MLTIELEGTPVGKGRPRFSRKSGRAYTPEATRSYEDKLRAAAVQVMGDREPLAGPLSVHVIACFEAPKSWAKWRKAAALAGEVRPTVKPDADNLAKMLDALNGVAWIDDSQIVALRTLKIYGAKPGLSVMVEEIDGAITAQTDRRAA